MYCVWVWQAGVRVTGSDRSTVHVRCDVRTKGGPRERSGTAVQWCGRIGLSGYKRACQVPGWMVANLVRKRYDVGRRHYVSFEWSMHDDWFIISRFFRLTLACHACQGGSRLEEFQITDLYCIIVHTLGKYPWMYLGTLLDCQATRTVSWLDFAEPQLRNIWGLSCQPTCWV